LQPWLHLGASNAVPSPTPISPGRPLSMHIPRWILWGFSEKQSKLPPLYMAVAFTEGFFGSQLIRSQMDLPHRWPWARECAAKQPTPHPNAAPVMLSPSALTRIGSGRRFYRRQLTGRGSAPCDPVPHSHMKTHSAPYCSVSADRNRGVARFLPAPS